MHMYKTIYIFISDNCTYTLIIIYHLYIVYVQTDNCNINNSYAYIQTLHIYASDNYITTIILYISSN